MSQSNTNIVQARFLADIIVLQQTTAPVALEIGAVINGTVERTKQMHTDIEKVHKEMWSAVKDRNEDAFAALSQEFERSSRILAEEWAQTSALAKIAVISESND